MTDYLFIYVLLLCRYIGTDWVACGPHRLLTGGKLMSKVLAAFIGKAMAVAVQEADGKKFPPLQPGEVSVGVVPEDLRALVISRQMFAVAHAATHEDIGRYDRGEGVQRSEDMKRALLREHTIADTEHSFISEIINHTLRLTYPEGFIGDERPEIREDWHIVAVPGRTDSINAMAVTIISARGML